MEFIAPVIDKTSPIPVYQQIYAWIKNEIIQGNLKGGEKLPSLRKMSLDQNISKNTILSAYDQLVAEGYVESVPKKGYLIASLRTMGGAPKLYCSVRETPAAMDYRYNLTGKGIDPDVFQKELWKKVTATVLREDFQEFTHYGEPQGELVLREEIVKYVYESRGIICSPHEIIIGAGTQSCLNLLCQMLLSLHPKVAYETPGTNWLRFMFERFGYEVTDLPILPGGYDVAHLEQSEADVIFVTPSHQFMKGKTISVENRLRLLEWAYTHNGLIIEDDYDSEVRYLSDTIPPMKYMDEHQSVVYISSLSKIFMPSLRIAFMILPPALLEVYHRDFALYEQTASAVHQVTLARFMSEGYFDSHIRRLKKQYRLKGDAIYQALQTYFSDKAEVIFSKGGVTLLLALNSDRSEETLVAQAREAGIYLKTVSEVYARHMEYHQMGRPKIYITFKMLPIHEIDAVMSLLAKVWFS